MPATRSASGPMEAPRSLAPISVGAPMRLALRAARLAVGRARLAVGGAPAVTRTLRGVAARAHGPLPRTPPSHRPCPPLDLFARPRLLARHSNASHRRAQE